MDVLAQSSQGGHINDWKRLMILLAANVSKQQCKQVGRHRHLRRDCGRHIACFETMSFARNLRRYEARFCRLRCDADAVAGLAERHLRGVVAEMRHLKHGVAGESAAVSCETEDGKDEVGERHQPHGRKADASFWRVGGST